MQAAGTSETWNHLIFTNSQFQVKQGMPNLCAREALSTHITPLVLTLKNNTTVTIDSGSLTTQSLELYGLSLWLAAEDLQRANNAIAQLVEFHSRSSYNTMTTSLCGESTEAPSEDLPHTFSHTFPSSSCELTPQPFVEDVLGFSPMERSTSSPPEMSENLSKVSSQMFSRHNSQMSFQLVGKTPRPGLVEGRSHLSSETPTHTVSQVFPSSSPTPSLMPYPTPSPTPSVTPSPIPSVTPSEAVYHPTLQINPHNINAFVKDVSLDINDTMVMEHKEALTHCIAKQRLLQLLVAVCVVEEVHYIQGFLHIFLNLCYLSPCPLNDIDYAFHFFRCFLTLTCPHLLRSSGPPSTNCESVKTLCLLFHQLLQYYFPTVAYHVDRLHGVAFWNLHWFDSLGTRCFSSPLKWLYVWYMLLVLYKSRIGCRDGLYTHCFGTSATHTVSFLKGAYTEWMLFILSVIYLLDAKHNLHNQRSSVSGKQLAQLLCGSHVTFCAAFWDDVCCTFDASLALPTSRHIVSKRNTSPPLSSHTSYSELPTFLRLMLHFSRKTPTPWLWRVSGNTKDHSGFETYSSRVPLYDYSVSYALPIFASELEYLYKIRCSSSNVCATPTHTAEGEVSKRSASWAAVLSFLQDNNTVDGRVPVFCVNGRRLRSHTADDTTLHRLQPKHTHQDSHGGEYSSSQTTLNNAVDYIAIEWYKSFHQRMPQQHESTHSKGPMTLIVPFNETNFSIASGRPVLSVSGMIKYAMQNEFIVLLTPCRPNPSSVAKGFQKCLFNLDTITALKGCNSSCWVSSSLDSTISLLRTWTTQTANQSFFFTVVQTDLNGNEVLQRVPHLVQDGVIQVVRHKKASTTISWASYTPDPSPCHLSFFLRSMESGIPYLTICPNFGSTASTSLTQGVQAILTGLKSTKLLPLSSSFFRRRVSQKTVPRTKCSPQECPKKSVPLETRYLDVQNKPCAPCPPTSSVHCEKPRKFSTVSPPLFSRVAKKIVSSPNTECRTALKAVVNKKNDSVWHWVQSFFHPNGSQNCNESAPSTNTAPISLSTSCETVYPTSSTHKCHAFDTPTPQGITSSSTTSTMYKPSCLLSIPSESLIKDRYTSSSTVDRLTNLLSCGSDESPSCMVYPGTLMLPCSSDALQQVAETEENTDRRITSTLCNVPLRDQCTNLSDSGSTCSKEFQPRRGHARRLKIVRKITNVFLTAMSGYKGYNKSRSSVLSEICMDLQLKKPTRFVDHLLKRAIQKNVAAEHLLANTASHSVSDVTLISTDDKAPFHIGNITLGHMNRSQLCITLKIPLRPVLRRALQLEAKLLYEAFLAGFRNNIQFLLNQSTTVRLMYLTPDVVSSNKRSLINSGGCLARNSHARNYIKHSRRTHRKRHRISVKKTSRESNKAKSHTSLLNTVSSSTSTSLKPSAERSRCIFL